MKSRNLLRPTVGYRSVGRVTMAGEIEHSPGVSSDPMRVLGSYALVLVTGGSGRYVDPSGRLTTVCAGDMIVLTPTAAHGYGPGPDEFWNEIYLVFDGPVFDSWADEINALLPIVRTQEPRFWQRRMRDVAQALTPLSQIALLQALLAQLVDLQARQHGKATHWFAHAQDLLSGPPGQATCEPQAVARALGVGDETFRKTFKRMSGMTPSRFRESAVMQHACGLLMSSELTLADIALQTGHYDAFHFSKRFKQFLALSPTAYRRQAGVGGVPPRQA
jgi:AraC-like DNA-binding protein